MGPCARALAPGRAMEGQGLGGHRERAGAAPTVTL
jgi:hypothetical protein